MCFAAAPKTANEKRCNMQAWKRTHESSLAQKCNGSGDIVEEGSRGRRKV